MLQTNNTPAYEALKKANDEFRVAIAIAADSPTLPSTVWNDIGRAMELQLRALDVIRPKGAPTPIAA